MPLNSAPIQEPITGPNGRVSQVWIRWFNMLALQLGIVIDGGTP